jgi:DNA-binding MarR family transcriptional regulator
MVNLSRYYILMKTPSAAHIRELIDRVARISAADEWTDDLNPSQRAALSYLSRANKFSRAPSNVADYLSATRGTVSQTLKALARKELVEEVRSQTDRRSISYLITAKGQDVLKRSTTLEHVLEQLPVTVQVSLVQGLEKLVRSTLNARGNKQFGQCIRCKYHQRRSAGGYCKLLKQDLAEDETLLICHEYQEAA